MATLDERIAKKMETLEQLKRQQRARDARERKKQFAIAQRRNTLIGETVSKYFPQVMKFQPKYKNADNMVEFMPLEIVCNKLAKRLKTDEEFRAWLCSDKEVEAKK